MGSCTRAVHSEPVFRLFHVPALLMAWFIGTDTALAVQSATLQVERKEGAYVLHAQMLVEVPLDEAYALLSDYDRLEQLSDIVKDSRWLDSPAAYRHRVYSLAELCILLFCAQVVQVQEVCETPKREILALTLPAQSNLAEGVIRWRLQPADGGTRLTVFARVVPDFWVPPVIGPWVVERTLADQVRETAENIERLAVPTSRTSLP